MVKIYHIKEYNYIMCNNMSNKIKYLKYCIFLLNQSTLYNIVSYNKEYVPNTFQNIIKQSKLIKTYNYNIKK